MALSLLQVRDVGTTTSVHTSPRTQHYPVFHDSRIFSYNNVNLFFSSFSSFSSFFSMFFRADVTTPRHNLDAGNHTCTLTHTHARTRTHTPSGNPTNSPDSFSAQSTYVLPNPAYHKSIANTNATRSNRSTSNAGTTSNAGLAQFIYIADRWQTNTTDFGRYLWLPLHIADAAAAPASGAGRSADPAITVTNPTSWKYDQPVVLAQDLGTVKQMGAGADPS